MADLVHSTWNTKAFPRKEDDIGVTPVFLVTILLVNLIGIWKVCVYVCVTSWETSRARCFFVFTNKIDSIMNEMIRALLA